MSSSRRRNRNTNMNRADATRAGNSGGGFRGPSLPPGASYRPVAPTPGMPLVPSPAYNTQYGAPYNGAYPSYGLQGNNSTPITAYEPPNAVAVDAQSGQVLYNGIGPATATPAVVGSAGQNMPQPPVSIFPSGDPVRPIPGLPPRQWAFPVGTNIAPVARGTEAISFPTLRNLSALYSGIGLCKRAIFRILERCELQVVPRPEVVGADDDPNGDQWMTPARYMQEWFEEGPAKDGRDLTSWMIAVLGELLDLDACGVWPIPTKDGRLYALAPIAGDTLQILTDDYGRIPPPYLPAYRQVLYGAPAFEFTRADQGRLDGLELDYLQIVTRADSHYGRPPVEDIILAVNQALRKQQYDLARFTDGATPEGVIESQAAEFIGKMTPDELMQWEQFWNGYLAGNTEMRVRTKFVPPGMHFMPLRSQDIATVFDDFLLSLTTAAYGLAKDEIGFAAGGRATGMAQEAVTYRNAVMPRTNYFGRYFTRIIRRYDGMALSPTNATISRAAGSPAKPVKGTWDKRYCVRWQGIEEPEDFNKRVSALTMLVNNGTISRTKLLKLLKIPLDKDEQEVPAFFTAQGGMQGVVIPADVAASRHQIQQAHSASLDASIASSKQVKQAMENPQQGMPGAPGAPNVGGNPIAAQAAAAGKPEAAMQAASGGVPAASAASGAAGGSAPVAQKAAQQQVGAKVQSASQAKPQQRRAADETREDDNGEYRVSGADRRDSADGDAHAAPGERGPAGASRTVGGRGSAAGWQSTAHLGGADEWRSAGGAPGGESHPSADQRGAQRRAASVERPGGADGANRRAAIAASTGTGTGASTGDGGSQVASSLSDGETASGIHERDQNHEHEGAVREEWKRYRERALRAIRAGKAVPAFVSDLLPREQHAWAASQLALARSREDVRAVFAEAQARANVKQGDPALPMLAGKDARDEDENEHQRPAKDTGLMVAFFVPADAARKLALSGYELARDLHVTLAFLGDKDQYELGEIRALRRLLATWASEQPRLNGRVTGVEQFPVNPEDNKYPLYAAVDIPRISAWRTRLVKFLDSNGFPVDKTFANYVPHITLAYVDASKEDKSPVDDVPHVSLVLDTLWLAAGDERYSFPIGDEQYPEQPQKRSDDAPDPLDRLAEALAARLERSNEAALREMRTRVLETIA